MSRSELLDALRRTEPEPEIELEEDDAVSYHWGTGDLTAMVTVDMDGTAIYYARMPRGCLTAGQCPPAEQAAMWVTLEQAGVRRVRR